MKNFLFIYEAQTPKERLSEFGNDTWLSNNKFRLLLLCFIYAVIGVTTYQLCSEQLGLYITIWGLLPFVTLLTHPDKGLVKLALYAVAFPSFLHGLYLARDESI